MGCETLDWDISVPHIEAPFFGELNCAGWVLSKSKLVCILHRHYELWQWKEGKSPRLLLFQSSSFMLQVMNKQKPLTSESSFINSHSNALARKAANNTEKEADGFVCFLVCLVCDAVLIVQLSCLCPCVRRLAKGCRRWIKRLFHYQSLEFKMDLEVDRA